MNTKTNKVDFTGQIFNVGIDVHKRNWRITIRSNGTFFRTMSVDPVPLTLYKTLTKAFPGGRFNTVYEAGFSGFWAHRKLVGLGINNIIVNPADVPTTNKEKERKNDPIDSNKLSRELDKGDLKAIFIPSEKQEGLRCISRLLDQYRKRSTQIKNRIKGLLHFTGVSIPSPDETSHWSNAFIEYLRRVDFSTDYHRFVMDYHISELLSIRDKQLRLLRRVREIFRKNEILQLLRSIPGIGYLTAFALYSELMVVKRFPNIDRLVSYVGLSPSTESSDEKTIIKGITYRHAKYLRYMLIEASWIAIRKDAALSMAYLNYCKRMPKQKAIIRIAKKMLGRIRYVWQNKSSYEIGIVE
jgi:transposase